MIFCQLLGEPGVLKVMDSYCGQQLNCQLVLGACSWCLHWPNKSSSIHAYLGIPAGVASSVSFAQQIRPIMFRKQ